MSRDPRLAEDLAAFTSRRPPDTTPTSTRSSSTRCPTGARRSSSTSSPITRRGVRVGSFVVFPEAQIGATATNNIFRNSARLADGALEVAANVRAVSDWRTHAVELRASGLATYYDQFPTEDDRSYAFEARTRSTSPSARTSSCWPCTRSTRTVRAQRNSPTRCGRARQRGDRSRRLRPQPPVQPACPCSCGARSPTSSSRP